MELFSREKRIKCIIQCQTVCFEFLAPTICQITIANDTDYKIANDQHNSRTAIFVHTYILDEKQDDILVGLLMLRTIIGIVQKSGCLRRCCDAYLLSSSI